MKRSRQTIIQLISVLGICSLLSGCTLMQLREENKISKASIVLAGTVYNAPSAEDLPVVVAAYAAADKKRTIVHYAILEEPGPYELMVPLGTHHLVAFGDRNKNRVYDPGEPAGQILKAETISPPAGGVAGNLNIVLSDHLKTDFPVGSPVPPKAHAQYHCTSPGTIADLDTLLFSDEYGKMGYWAGIEFFQEVGGNIYFLEPYDPNKIPILFVHGAAGSPQNWRTFFDRIDRETYQPWFFYYPSGSSIDAMSHLLFWKLQNLQAKYKFNQLCITAHSMGGLVVRSFMVNYGAMFPSINCFISISTPWGGEPRAETGVKYSPAVIPSWRDMQPGSSFFESIYSKKMPEGVNHYLLFGHKGDRNLLRPNNDKAVTLASQLDPRSQRDATMIYGFDEDHISILSSPQVLSRYNAILADTYEGTADAVTGNRIRIDFTFDFPDERPRPMLILNVRPVDPAGTESWIYIRPEDAGREYGPFPPGEYEVTLLAEAFMPEPFHQVIRLEEHSVPEISFRFKPTGYLRGYVIKQEERDIQLGESPQPDAQINIESITLQNETVDRTLIPVQGEKSYADYFLSATDFSSDGAFFFFGLPAGTVNLTLNAEGYEPYSERQTIVPGHYQNTLVIELVKKANGSP